jgi:glycine cleavage system aminomethyltransferase T
VGTTTSAGFGYTVDRTIALGYLPAELNGSAFAIEAYGRSYPAERGGRSLYDPKSDRLRS